MRLFAPRHERRYRAALTIYMAAHTYQSMTPSERQKVDARVYENLSGKLQGVAPVEFQRLWSPAVKAAYRAYAMQDLGIPAAVDGERWNLPKARRWWGSFSQAPFLLHRDYRVWGDATMQAQSYLESKGVDVRSLEAYVSY